MLKYEKYFKVIGISGKRITLASALRLGRQHGLIRLAYDPEGKNNSTSFSWCSGILASLKSHDLIRNYEVLKPNPVQVESKRGRIYSERR